MKMEQICPAEGTVLSYNENKKPEPAFYLQNRCSEWKRSVARSTREVPHVRTPFHRISIEFLSNFYRARDVRPYGIRDTYRTSLPSMYRETSIRCKHTNCRYRIPIVFFSSGIFNIFTRLLNTPAHYFTLLRSRDVFLFYFIILHLSCNKRAEIVPRYRTNITGKKGCTTAIFLLIFMFVFSFSFRN